MYGLKAISGINEDIIDMIYKGRPYLSFKDFLNKCNLNKVQMFNLIKAGAFDNLDKVLNNRIKILTYYISTICEPKSKLNLQNLNGLIERNLIPIEQYEKEIRVFHFNKFLKQHCKNKTYYVFTDSCNTFFEKYFNDYVDSLEMINGVVAISQSQWDKIYKETIEKVKLYIAENQSNLLSAYNFLLFKEYWDKYADNGNLSKQEMNAVCFYYHEHELAHIDNHKYGLSNFFNLNPASEIDYYFKRGDINIPIYKLQRIAGTVISKDDMRSIVTLLTVNGVVDVKMSREQYSKYKSQLSEIDSITNKKTVVEKGWFTKGNHLIFTGYRRDDVFVCKTYKQSQSKSLYKINNIIGTELSLQSERYSSNNIIAEEDYGE